MRHMNAAALLIASALSVPFGSVSAQVSTQQQRQEPGISAKTTISAVQTRPIDEACYSAGVRYRATEAVYKTHLRGFGADHMATQMWAQKVSDLGEEAGACTKVFATTNKDAPRFEKAIRAINAGGSSRADINIVACLAGSSNSNIGDCGISNNASAVGGTGDVKNNINRSNQGHNTENVKTEIDANAASGSGQSQNNNTNSNTNSADSNANIQIQIESLSIPYYQAVGQGRQNMDSGQCPRLKTRDPEEVLLIGSTTYRDTVAGGTIEIYDYMPVKQIMEVLECKP